tara:strand:+ start:16116 stop:16808 length:693 start_codon:yes stop_codon:yes gene_type:complete
VRSIANILPPNKSLVKRTLKWIVIVNAVLAAAGIVIGGSTEFVARVHGTSFLLVITAASLVSIELGKFRTQLRMIWPIGSGSSLLMGLVVISLIWGASPPDVLGRPIGTVAVAAVAITYCAIISVIAERATLRAICWIGALVYSCYVWALIWLDFDAMPGRILALLAVLQSACSLLAVIDFIAARRAARDNAVAPHRAAAYCPYCGSTELSISTGDMKCNACGQSFRLLS